VLIGEMMPSPPPVVVVPPFPGSVVAKPSPAGQSAQQAEKAGPAKAEPKKGGEKPVYRIEFELVGEDGKGMPLEKYRVTLPDGTVREGVTGFNGGVTIDGIESQGSCKISFPELDQDCWEEA
jgi:hypothetical protein